MKNYLIELIGTFFLVLIIGLIGNPIAIGFGLIVLIYMGFHISGAHYNPVVTLAMLYRREKSVKQQLSTCQAIHKFQHKSCQRSTGES